LTIFKKELYYTYEDDGNGSEVLNKSWRSQMTRITTQTQIVATNSSIELLAFCHFYNEGERGERGGSASNDKVWGVAKINGTLVNFWGRRNGTMSFKTFLGSQMEKVMAKYREKTGARRDGSDIYTGYSTTSQLVACLTPDLHANLSKTYYSKMAKGMLNTSH